MKNFSAGDSFEGRYEIRTELGRDRHAVTYRAWSSDSGHEVVVRLLVPPPGGYPSGLDARFMSEAKHVAKLRHAAAVRLESFGATADGTLFLVSELVPGVSLPEHPVAPGEVVGLVARLAACLGEAHARGIIHRDLTPHRVMIPPGYGVPGAKLRGFGITTAADDEATADPRYVAPEQLTGAPSEPAANVYSLGLILGELFSGEPLVRGATAAQLHAIHLSPAELDIPPRVPPAVRPIVQRMLAKNPQQRFASMDEVAAALRSVDPHRDAALPKTLRDPPRNNDSTLREVDDVDIPTRERLNAVPRARRPNPELHGNIDVTLVESAIAEEIPTDEIDHRMVPRGAAQPAPAARKPASARPKSAASHTEPPRAEEDRVSPWVAVVVLLGAVGAALGVANLVKSPAEEVETIATRGVQVNPFAHVEPELPPTPREAEPVDIDEPAVAAPVTGCGVQLAPGWTSATQMSGLTARRHHVRVPQQYDGSPVPLILVVRPLQLPAKLFIETTGLDRLADDLNAMLIVPADASDGLRPWLGDFEAAVAEFNRVLDHATATYCIDALKVYGIGASSGASALDMYSCANPGLFDALGLVTSWTTKDAECIDSAARVYVNGESDPVSPFLGGSGCWGGTYRLAVPEMIERRRKQLSCGDQVEWLKYPAGSCQRFEGCDATLAHCAVPEAVHEWPGSRLNPIHCPFVIPQQPQPLEFPTTEVLTQFLQARSAAE